MAKAKKLSKADLGELKSAVKNMLKTGKKLRKRASKQMGQVALERLEKYSGVLSELNAAKPRMEEPAHHIWKLIVRYHHPATGELSTQGLLISVDGPAISADIVDVVAAAKACLASERSSVLYPNANIVGLTCAGFLDNCAPGTDDEGK